MFLAHCTETPEVKYCSRLLHTFLLYCQNYGPIYLSYKCDSIQKQQKWKKIQNLVSLCYLVTNFLHIIFFFFGKVTRSNFHNYKHNQVKALFIMISVDTTQFQNNLVSSLHEKQTLQQAFNVVTVKQSCSLLLTPQAQLFVQTKGHAFLLYGEETKHWWGWKSKLFVFLQHKCSS